MRFTIRRSRPKRVFSEQYILDRFRFAFASRANRPRPAPVKVFACQLDIVWEDKVENFVRVRSLLQRQRLDSGALVVLPEMFATGFSMNREIVGEPADGPTGCFIRDLARENGVYVLAGLARRDDHARVFNEAVCLGPSGRCIARYAKLHLFSPGGEEEHYAPGSAITLFKWGSLRVAVYICYDLRFPEVFRMGAQRGAGVLVVIANWPARRRAHWSALLRARAIENQAYVIGVNRCGRDPYLDYAGGSAVIDPQGNTVASAGLREGIVSARLDPLAPSRWRREFPVLKDIRTGFTLNCRAETAARTGEGPRS